jgi:probable rRNA maturation factor
MNRNSRVPSARTLGRFLAEARAAVRLRGQVSVLLTTDRNIRRLNRQFRGKDKATDVLSFPASEPVGRELAGDLAVSVPTALRQSRERGHALGVELKVLILHGLLHLAGFDHESDNGEMGKRERLLRVKLRLPQGLIERSAVPQLPRAQSSRLASAARAGDHKSPRPTSESRRATTGTSSPARRRSNRP